MFQTKVVDKNKIYFMFSCSFPKV